MKSSRFKNICIFILLAVSLFCFQNISADNTKEIFTINQSSVQSEQNAEQKSDKNNTQDKLEPPKPSESSKLEENQSNSNGNDPEGDASKPGVPTIRPEERPQQGETSQSQNENVSHDSANVPESGNSVKGKLYVKRTIKSEESLVSNAPKVYMLGGAEYTVYSDSTCINKVGTLTCTAQKKDLNGKLYAESNIIDLYAGTYYIKETKKSEGYMPDETVYTADVSGDINVVNTLASPRFESMDMTMKFQMLNYNGQVNLPKYQKYFDVLELEIWYIPEYCETIEDARKIKPLKKWKLGADKNGEVKYNDAYWKEDIDLYLKSDKLFKNDKGEIVGMLGTYLFIQSQEKSTFPYNREDSMKVLKEGKPFGDFDAKNNTALNVESHRRSIGIIKEYSKDDIYTPFGNRIASLYCIEGNEVWGNDVKRYVAVRNFPPYDIYHAEGYCNLDMGEYAIKEVKTARYKSSNISVTKGGTIDSDIIRFELVENNEEAVFKGTLAKWNNYSSCELIESGSILL